MNLVHNIKNSYDFNFLQVTLHVPCGRTSIVTNPTRYAHSSFGDACCKAKTIHFDTKGVSITGSQSASEAGFVSIKCAILGNDFCTSLFIEKHQVHQRTLNRHYRFAVRLSRLLLRRLLQLRMNLLRKFPGARFSPSNVCILPLRST